VGALAMHPANTQVLIAGCGKGAATFMDEPDDLAGGVFKTTDGGQHWRKVDSFGRGNGVQVTAVAFAPSDPSIAYADRGQIFMRSRDGGDTWQWFSADAAGENRGTPISLAVHPDNPGVIFMNAYGGGVFLSTDSGTTWQDASSGYTGSQSWSVAADGSDASRVLVGSKNGVYLSANSGLTWQGRNSGGVNEVQSVAIDPSNRDTWLAGRLIDATISRTADGGASWAVVLPPLGTDTMTGGRRSVHRIAFAPSAPSLVYAATGIAPGYVSLDTTGTGVYASSDGGRTWNACNHGLDGTKLNAMAVAVHPQDASTVYIGMLGDGVYKSADGGASWLPARQGLLATDIRAVAIDPFTPTTIYAGAERGGIWRSTDAGASWKQIANGMPAEATVHAIVVDATRSGTVFAGDQQSGVYRSTDGGTTWAAINNGLRNRAVNALALTPDGRHLYAATEGNGVYRLDLPETHVPRKRLRPR
jgi:photosystem II stability/assembly factor-like uncharacterized protein